MENTFNIGPRKIRFSISNFGTRKIYIDDCLVDSKRKLLRYGIQEVQIDGKPLRFELPSKDTGKNSVYYDGSLIIEELLPELVSMANDSTRKLNAFSSKIRPIVVILIAIAALLTIYNNVAA